MAARNSRGCGTGHADEVALVTGGRLNIEAREPQRGGSDEQERRTPSQAPERRQPPLERQDGGGHAERDHVGQRIELEPELAGAAHHSCDAAVEHVEHDGNTDERCGLLVLPTHRVDHARIAAEQVGEREKARQDVDAPPEPALLVIAAAAQRVAEPAVKRRLGRHVSCLSASTEEWRARLPPTAHGRQRRRELSHPAAGRDRCAIRTS